MLGRGGGSKFAVTPAIALCNVSIHFSKEKLWISFYEYRNLYPLS